MHGCIWKKRDHFPSISTRYTDKFPTGLLFISLHIYTLLSCRPACLVTRQKQQTLPIILLSPFTLSLSLCLSLKRIGSFHFSAMGNCCHTFFDLFALSSTSSSTSTASTNNQARVGFDTTYRSPQMIITDGRLCAEGDGTVLCDTPIDQLRAFWEFTLVRLPETSSTQQTTTSLFSIGVVRRANLKPPPNDDHFLSKQLGVDRRSKCLSSKESGVTFTQGDVLGKCSLYFARYYFSFLCDCTFDRPFCVSNIVYFSFIFFLGLALDMNYKRLTFYINGISMDIEMKVTKFRIYFLFIY